MKRVVPVVALGDSRMPKPGYIRVDINRDKLMLFLESFNYASALARDDKKYHAFFYGRAVAELINQFNDVVYKREEKKSGV
jgi:soluble lytic murein transglycosylase-like protein